MLRDQKKGRVGVMVSYFPSVSETFIVNQMIALKKQGVTIDVMARVLKGPSEGSQTSLIKKHHLLDTANSYLPVIPKGKTSKFFGATLLLLKNPHKIGLFFKTLNATYGVRGKSLKLWFEAIHFSKFKEISFFHAHFALNGQHIARMHDLGITNTPFGVTFHGYDAHANSIQEKEWLKKEYGVMFKLASFITVNTAYLKTKLLDLGCPDEKIEIVPVGLNPDYFDYFVRSKKDVIKLISVGRLIELKGFEFGLRCTKKLIDMGYNVHYSIIGDGDEFEKLHTIASELRISSFVSILKAKSQEELKLLYNESDIFLMTSITDSEGREEAQGLVSVEAQSTGLPVVAFNSGGVSETILDGQTGFLVAEKDYDEMAKKTAYLINNFDKRMAFGELGRKNVIEKFDQEKLVSTIVELYSRYL